MNEKIKSVFKVLCGAAFFCAVAVSIPQLTKTAQAAVTINEDNFPDYNFRSFITKNLDKDSDGVLSDDEIHAVTSLKINYYDIGMIYDLTGIEIFTSLENLNCYLLDFKSLDISKNTKLEELYLERCDLTEVDISKNTKLETLVVDMCEDLTGLDVSQNKELKILECVQCNLTELDVSQNSQLKELVCHQNYLTKLDVSKNTNLEKLICNDFGNYGTKLTELDVSQNTKLKILDCEYNDLTKIDLSHNLLLEYLNCGYNGLTELDVSKNTNLQALDCYNNNLTELNISNNIALRYLDCSSNKLTNLDASNNIVLGIEPDDDNLGISYYDMVGLHCRYNPLTMLKLNKKCQNVPLSNGIIHGENTVLSNLINIEQKRIDECDNWFNYPADPDDKAIIVSDITKPATYQYSNPNIANGTPIDFTILYVDDADDSVLSSSTRLFYDYGYSNPVSGTAVTIYGNGTRENKVFTAYTDILASYSYTTDAKGKVKSSVGKVIVGITMSDTKPTISKEKIVDADAAKIAKAKIKNGEITVTAAGKAGGVVYLWIMDTGKKGVSECCPINVKLAPTKLEVQNTSGSKVKDLKIAKGSSADVIIAGLVGTTKTEDCNYTVAVDSKSQSYVKVTSSGKNRFTLTGTGLNNNKNTKVSVTFTCVENNKKVKFTATITK